jgi:hypothetical protein
MRPHKALLAQVKKRDLDSIFPADKAQKLFDMRKNGNLVTMDSDFPDDEDEAWVWVRQGDQYQKTDGVEESLKASNERELNQDETQDLLGEGGILQAGGMAGLQSGGAETQKAFDIMMATSVNSELGKASAERKKHLNNTVTEQKPPDTPLQKAINYQGNILRESNEARNFTMRLKGTQCSAELLSYMEKHTTFLDKSFAVLQKFCGNGVNSEAVYAPLYTKIEERRQGYALRRAAAKGLESALKRQQGGSSDSGQNKRKKKTEVVSDQQE